MIFRQLFAIIHFKEIRTFLRSSEISSGPLDISDDLRKVLISLKCRGKIL
jgi:hypothetical protein